MTRITHEEVNQLLVGSDNEQSQTITLELVFQKITEYESGRMILVTKEEYEKLLSYVKQQAQNELTLTEYIKLKLKRFNMSKAEFEEMKKLEYILAVNMGVLTKWLEKKFKTKLEKSTMERNII